MGLCYARPESTLGAFRPMPRPSGNPPRASGEGEWNKDGRVWNIPAQKKWEETRAGISLRTRQWACATLDRNLRLKLFVRCLVLRETPRARREKRCGRKASGSEDSQALKREEARAGISLRTRQYGCATLDRNLRLELFVRRLGPSRNPRARQEKREGRMAGVSGIFSRV